MTADRPDPKNDDRAGGGPGTLRWVYAFGIIALLLFLLFVILHLTGHGLGGHGL